MTPTYIDTLDFLLLPFVLLFLYAAGVYIRNKFYTPGHPYYTYFLPFLMLKVMGAVAFGCIYQFYYGYGDTFRFYGMGVFFNDILRDAPDDFFKVYFTGTTDYYAEKSFRYDFDFLYNPHLQNVVVSRFSSFIGLFTFDNYLLISIGFSIISATGLWKLWQCFSGLYPSLTKPLGWCILFVPSIIFWGSGLIKDSLTIGALGWLMYGCWRAFYLKKNLVQSSAIIFVAALLLFLIKSYILLSFMPALLIWISFRYYKSINNRQLRLLVVPFILSIVALIGIAVNNVITEYYEELAFEQIASTAINQQYNIQKQEAGSSYNLGELDPSLVGVLSKVPLAILTTLFRPFIWEINSLVMLFSALESLAVLVFTLWVLFKVGFRRFFGYIFNKNMVGVCFLFSLVFSIGIAISSGNFGTLVRYKLPCIPFYLIGLLLIYYYEMRKSPFEVKKKERRKYTRPVAIT